MINEVVQWVGGGRFLVLWLSHSTIDRYPYHYHKLLVLVPGPVLEQRIIIVRSVALLHLKDKNRFRLGLEGLERETPRSTTR